MSAARRLTTFLTILLGAALGVGLYTFIYARAASYLTDQPDACANCHVMQDHFRGWMKSSHGHVAVCNDCHTPSGLLAKYSVKAQNGFWHSFAFTTGRFPDQIQITDRNFRVADTACVKCHREIVHAIEQTEVNRLSCVRCHSSVGHME